jgi:hypothetical protein
MIRLACLLAIAALFGLAAFVTVQVNQIPRFAMTPAIQAEIAGLLQQNGLTPQPMEDPPGQLIDLATRFSAPDCPVDGFLLPMADTVLAEVQAIRFTEITGATYLTTRLSIAAKSGTLQTRAARAWSALNAAFRPPTARNGDIVLTIFFPDTCPVPTPDMRSFWEIPAPET